MRFLGKTPKFILYIGVCILIFYILLNLFTKPSNNRDWADDQTVLSTATIQGDIVTVHNIRNFTYASTTSFTKDWYNKSYNVQNLERVWYIVEPFSGIPGSAHTFLSFEFNENEKKEYLALSVEIRKEKGESFHPIKALFNQYELMYVAGDEDDLIKLRTNYRKDEVYLYPVKADKEKVVALFIDMIERMNTLEKHPEFYNTLTNTCTTNIAKHIRKVSPGKIPFFAHEIIFPAYSDKFAYTLGLIDTTLSFEDTRKKYHINERALSENEIPFSERIRRF
jgi:hypothetical protein